MRNNKGQEHFEKWGAKKYYGRATDVEITTFRKTFYDLHPDFKLGADIAWMRELGYKRLKENFNRRSSEYSYSIDRFGKVVEGRKDRKTEEALKNLVEAVADKYFGKPSDKLSSLIESVNKLSKYIDDKKLKQ